jgi:hypothetical protein
MSTLQTAWRSTQIPRARQRKPLRRQAIIPHDRSWGDGIATKQDSETCHQRRSKEHPDYAKSNRRSNTPSITRILTRAPLLRISLATPVRSKLGKCYSDAKIYRCLRRDRSVLPIGHPLSCNKQAHRGQSRANERSAYPDAEWQYGRRMSMPGQRPSGLRGSQVPFIPEMKCEHRLKKECILRWPIR